LEWRGVLHARPGGSADSLWARHSGLGPLLWARPAITLGLARHSGLGPPLWAWRPSERGTPIQYRRAEAKAIIKVERIKEAIGGGRPETIQKVGVRRGYKSRENQGGHHRGGPRQYKRWEVEAVIKGKITPKVNNKVKNMAPRVSHWRPKSLQGYPRRGSENEVAKKTLQGGKEHRKRLQNETTKSQGWW
jgi:hypothetical protein